MRLKASLPSRETWLAVLLFTALTLLFAYPLSLHPSSLRFPTGPDGDLGWYLLGWNTHAFLHRPWAIFDANIYYPERLTLAFGENIIGIAFFAAPVIWLGGNLLLAANIVCLLSSVLCGLGAYVLVRRLGLSVAAAVVCGIIFECAPPRFFRIGQMPLSNVQWIPFGLAALHGYLDTGRKRDLRLAAGCVSLQTLSSGHGAVFMAVTLLVLGLYRVLLGEPLRLIRRVRDLGVVGAVLLLPTFLVFLPYRAVQQEAGLKRGLGSWGVNYADFLASPSHLHQFLLSLAKTDVTRGATAFLFPGYLPIVLALVALLWPTRLPALGRGETTRPREGAGDVDASAAGLRPPHGPSTLDLPSTVRPRQTDVAEIVAAGPATPPTLWTRAAFLTTLAAFASLAVAAVLSYVGPVRLRVGLVLLSARTPWRAWMLAAVFVVCRLAMVRRAPFNLRRSLRATRSAISRISRGAWFFARHYAHRLFVPVRGLMVAAWIQLEPVRSWVDVRRRDATTFYAVFTFVAFWLALGPPYGLWQFVYWLPGLNFIRATSRFALVGLLGIAVLAGIGFDKVSARLTRRWRVVLSTLVGGLLVAEYAAMPMAVQPSNLEVPAIDRWLDNRPKPFVVAEVPVHRISDWAFERQEAAYMIHSTAHWQKTVHGYSGWRTQLHWQLYSEMQTFPDETSIAHLSDLGVTYVVVHADLYPPEEWSGVEERLRAFSSRLRLEHVEGTGRVYALLRPLADTIR